MWRSDLTGSDTVHCLGRPVVGTYSEVCNDNNAHVCSIQASNSNGLLEYPNNNGRLECQRSFMSV